MISAEELYRKIESQYPGFTPPRTKLTGVGLPDGTDKPYYQRIYPVRDNPPLTAQQLEMLEMGFPVKPNYNPFFYGKPSEEFKRFVDQMLEEKFQPEDTYEQ